MHFARTRRLLAVAALSAAASGIGVISAPAAGAAPTSVAIVISRSGGVTLSACLPWTGASGDAILHQVTSVGYDASGAIDQLGGYPSPPTFTASEYWVYYHNTGAGWSYSHTGASGAHPAAGTVEGWRYDNADAATPYPPNVTYAQICTPPATSQASAPPAPVTVPKTTTAAAVPTHAATSAAGSSATHSSAASTSTAASTTTAAGSTAASGAPSSSGSSSGSSGAIDGTSVTSSHASSVSKAVPKKSSSSGSIIAVIIGGVLVVALAAGSIVVAQRRRAS